MKDYLERFLRDSPAYFVTITSVLEVVNWQVWVYFLSAIYIVFQIAHYLWCWKRELDKNRRRDKNVQEKRKREET